MNPLPPYGRDDLAAELRLAGADVPNNGKAFKCPFHEDKHPSGGLYLDKDSQRWRYKCQAASCGVNYDLYDARADISGRTLSEVIREATGRAEPPKPIETYSLEQLKRWRGVEAVYSYTNPDTKAVDLLVLRIVEKGKKRFSQLHPHGDGFATGGCLGLNPIYNRGRVCQAERVVVVEGEKCVHCLHGLGIVATTSPMGYGNADKADWALLAGKSVVIWRDNDEAGLDYQNAVVEILSNLDPAPSVRLVDIEALDLPAKGDVVDYIVSLADERVDAQRLAVLDVLADAKMAGGQGIQDLIDEIRDGRHDVISSGFREIDWLTQALMAGTLTVICGTAGSAKSFFLVQIMTLLTARGEKVALFELEDDKKKHLQRILAQLVENPNYLRPAWVKDHIEQVEAANDEHHVLLNTLRSRMWQAPKASPTFRDMLQWVKARAEEGYKVIAIDPVTAMEPTQAQWVTDQQFLIEAKAIIRDYDARLILVTHPKSGTKKPSMDALAGGMAYNRFPHTILWLEMTAKVEQMEIENEGMTAVNRRLHLVKTRNGPGQGLTLGMLFKKGTLRFQECGILVK